MQQLNATQFFLVVAVMSLFVVPLGAMLGGLCLRAACAIFNWLNGAPTSAPEESEAVEAIAISEPVLLSSTSARDRPASTNPYQSPLALGSMPMRGDYPGNGVYIPMLGWAAMQCAIATVVQIGCVAGTFLIANLVIEKVTSLHEVPIMIACLGFSLPVATLTLYVLLAVGLPANWWRAAGVTLIAALLVGLILAVLVPAILFVIALMVHN